MVTTQTDFAERHGAAIIGLAASDAREHIERLRRAKWLQRLIESWGDERGFDDVMYALVSLVGASEIAIDYMVRDTAFLAASEHEVQDLDDFALGVTVGEVLAARPYRSPAPLRTIDAHHHDMRELAICLTGVPLALDMETKA